MDNGKAFDPKLAQREVESAQMDLSHVNCVISAMHSARAGLETLRWRSLDRPEDMDFCHPDLDDLSQLIARVDKVLAGGLSLRKSLRNIVTRYEPLTKAEDKE